MSARAVCSRRRRLRNADFNAPYFHDGRFDSYDQVVAHFDRVFDLGLSAQDRSDLVAYLTAVGDGVQPYERDGAGATLKEINDFTTVLGDAIPADDKDIVALAVDTIGSELRELTERYPDRKNTSVSGGAARTRLARDGAQGTRSNAPANRYGGCRRSHFATRRPTTGIIAT